MATINKALLKMTVDARLKEIERNRAALRAERAKKAAEERKQEYLRRTAWGIIDEETRERRARKYAKTQAKALERKAVRSRLNALTHEYFEIMKATDMMERISSELNHGQTQEASQTTEDAE